MSRRVPLGGLGPEWPNEPDDGQAQGDQGAQRNGNGAPGQDQQQRQYGQYGGPGRSGPAGYGQQQPYGGQGGNGQGPQGYDQPGPPPGPGQGYDNQPTQTFSYQGRGATYPGKGTRAAARRLRRRTHAASRTGAGKETCASTRSPQRFDDQRYQLPGQGPGGPALPGAAVAGRPAAPEGPVPPDSPVLPPSFRPHRQRRDRALPPLCHVLRWPGGVQEQWPGCVGEPRGMGQGPLPRPGRDVRRVAVLQPAAEGRQAVVLARRAQRRGGQPGQAGEGQRQEGFRARHPGHAEVPRGLVDRGRRPVARGGKGQRRAGDPDDVPARRDVHVRGQRHRVDRPAAGQVLAAPGHGRPGTRQLGRAELHPGRPAHGPARHVQRRVQAGLGGWRLLPQRHLPRLARQRRRVGRLLQERRRSRSASGAGTSR